MQSEVLQQSPALHEPPQHLRPKPQSVSREQAAHRFAVQIWPEGQSERVQQVAFATQAPPQHRPPAPQSALSRQAAQELFTQTNEPQFAVVQQLPVRQTPLQQTWPLPQSVFRVHATHWKPLQIWPAGHGAPGQQLPVWQVPLQQTLPPPHCPSEVHDWQAFWRHCSGAGHWLSVQHSPETHTLLQHTSAKPVQGFVALQAWPIANVASAVGAIQRPSEHTRPEAHSEVWMQPPRLTAQMPSRQPGRSWQTPSVHWPAQQLSPVPHWRSEVHAPHWWAVQIWPDSQSPAAQQSPAVHTPPQHTAPAPHWAESVQASQRWLAPQTRPSQSFAPQQSPCTQVPPQQRPLDPHSPSNTQALPVAQPSPVQGFTAGGRAGFGAAAAQW